MVPTATKPMLCRDCAVAESDTEGTRRRSNHLDLAAPEAVTPLAILGP